MDLRECLRMLIEAGALSAFLLMLWVVAGLATGALR